MEWNADLYENQHGFVAQYGKALLELIPDKPGLHILDLGCGTGTLTQELSRRNALVIGVDASEEMIKKAKQLHPGLRFQVEDACQLSWNQDFDIVFSNAVFHWIPDQPKLLGSVYRALKPGGLLLCEFGAYGNVASIEAALVEVLESFGITYVSSSFFPKEKQYRMLLEDSGFVPVTIQIFDRPTPLPGGPQGLRLWLTQFRSHLFHHLPQPEQEEIYRQLEARLQPKLWNGTNWTADYRRIRVHAERPSQAPAKT